MKRYIDTRHGTNLSRPQSTAIHHEFSAHITVLGSYAYGLPIFNVDTRYLYTLDNLGTAQLCAPRQRLGGIDGVSLAVSGEMHCTHDIINIEQWPQLQCPLR